MRHVPPGPAVERAKSPRSRARVLDRLLRDAGLRRRTFLSATGIAVILVVLATVLLTVIPLSSFKTTSDRLVWAGDVLVGATLLLAAIAAIVALVAYAVSTGAPDIQLSVQFGDSSPNKLAFKAEARDSIPGALIMTSKNAERLGKILLRNNSGYSARNPAVIVRLHGMFFRSSDPTSFEREWAAMELAETQEFTSSATAQIVRSYVDKNMLTMVQWDGGPTYSVHGHSIRRLPDLQFSWLFQVPDWGEPILTFEILAEGYRKVVSLPVDFIMDGKSQYTREKALPEWL
jgi:hypothetical protein